MKKFLLLFCSLVLTFSISITAFSSNHDLSLNSWLVIDGNRVVTNNSPADFDERVEVSVGERFTLFGGYGGTGIDSVDRSWTFDDRYLNCRINEIVIECDALTSGFSEVYLTVNARMVDGSQRTVSSNVVSVRVADASNDVVLPFPDVSNSLYFDAINSLYVSGVINGYPDGTYQPARPINRAEFLKMVYESKGGLFGDSSGQCFPDVPANEWFSLYVCAAKSLGIVEGYPDGRFRPEQNISIPEAIKIVLTLYGNNNSGRGLFAGEQWYDPYMKEAIRLGIFPFYITETTYSNYLTVLITRQQTALVLFNADGVLNVNPRLQR